MEVVQPPRRRAAIKAATNFAESSSDEGKGSDNETDDYHATQRVRGSNSKKDGGGTKIHSRKRSTVVPQDVDASLTGTSTRKRKRTATANVGAPRKRPRGAGLKGTGLTEGGGVDNDSDLTPLSSDDEQEEVKRFIRPLAEFPLQFTPPASSSKLKHKKQNQTKLEVFHL
jgi:hypothetical protein